MRVQVAADATDIKIGDYVGAYCWLDGFSEPSNPGQFNLKEYLAQRGVFVGASVKSRGGIELLDVRGQDIFIKMSGGCQGCSMARATLRDGVEQILRGEIADLGALHDVTDHAGGADPYIVRP